VRIRAAGRQRHHVQMNPDTRLRCLNVLAKSADSIGEADEAARCAQFLRDSDPAAADALT